jgi:hypothetical protein
MQFSNNISTNIIRDSAKEIDYVVTPNTKGIFDRIFINNYGANKSFNLIGNYGTGKSTFLWALEKNLNNEKLFFNPVELGNGTSDGYDFIKIIGDSSRLLDTFGNKLRLRGNIDNQKVLAALEKKRKASAKKKKGLIIIIDEFGKHLEYASKNFMSDDLYLLQQISEWANDDSNETFFITTLHQNFSSYGKNLPSQDKTEWEKVKGRFVDLVFNEPVEQLIYFAGKKLKEFILPDALEQRFNELLKIIRESMLVSHNKSISDELSKSLYPLDWLSANILVNSLQRYGQNERSLFSFLNDDTKYSIKNIDSEFYTVANIYDYLVNTLPTEINSPDNAHRAQWVTAFRALERAELIFEENYELAAEVIKTICLVNIFSKMGGLFDSKFLINYFKLSRKIDVSLIIDKLDRSGIIRFYRYSNKINFFDGTDLDLEQELIDVSKQINPNINISKEIIPMVNLPVLLVKRYSFETGTKRFFEYRFFDSFDNLSFSEGPIDGFINLVFDETKISTIKERSQQYTDQLFVHYKNLKQIKSEVLTILKFDKLIENNQSDRNALKLLTDERGYHMQKLKNIVVDQLFLSNDNQWIYNGKNIKINSKHELYDFLTTEVCYKIYNKTPIFKNELINKHALSAPINTARKYLFRAILSNSHEENLLFDNSKFPPEKAIYISLLKETNIHKKNDQYGYYELSKPKKDSNFYDLWITSEEFLEGARSNKRNLIEFYDLLTHKPFKLKRGFIDFWIPIFLISKKEDYALFHLNGSYIPFIQEDTLDLIHRKPEDYIIKSYDVSGLNINLLESYKELVQINNSPNKGTQTTFLSIFGNFLRFQRNLNQYTLKTQNLSNTAIKLREAILKSKDPEDALFNQFPTALGYHSLTLKDNEEVLESFTNNIQNAITEIRDAYDNLLERVEKAIISNFDCTEKNFKDYKQEIISKLGSLNENYLSKKHAIFYKRLTSKLDDKTSWIKSVADVAIEKPIDNLLDSEEELLMRNIEEYALSLIKAAELKDFNDKSGDQKLHYFRYFGEDGQKQDFKSLIKRGKSKNYQKSESEILSFLDNNLNEDERKQLLLDLLLRELKSQ